MPPALAQLPIWAALYSSLQTSVELFHTPFALWYHDLSAPDPFFVLPLVLGAMMFLQQKIMPPQGVDPMQTKMLIYFMPGFMTLVSLLLPSGLALYMLVNTMLGIAQDMVHEATHGQHQGRRRRRPKRHRRQAPRRDRQRRRQEVERDRAAPPVDRARRHRSRVDLLSTTLADMGFECTVHVHEQERETVFELMGPDAQHVRGQEGRDARRPSRCSPRASASKHLHGERCNLVTDAAGWREQRERMLTSMAEKLGKQCVSRARSS